MLHLPSWMYSTAGIVLVLFAFDTLRDLLVKIEKNTRTK